MGKQKGCIKTGGRKAGTPNKVTGTIKDFVSELINQNREQIKNDLKSLKPKDRLFVIEKFMQYVIPKQQSVKGDIFFDKLTEEQVTNVADELLNKIEE